MSGEIVRESTLEAVLIAREEALRLRGPDSFLSPTAPTIDSLRFEVHPSCTLSGFPRFYSGSYGSIMRISL